MSAPRLAQPQLRPLHTENGSSYRRAYPVRKLAFPDVHHFRPAWQSSAMCGTCFCPVDDWRHNTPIALGDRLFSSPAQDVA